MSADPEILSKLLGITDAAAEAATVAVLEAIALETGHPTVRGIPVRQFYLQERARAIEHLIAHYADFDPNVATQLKAELDKRRAPGETSL